MESAECWWCGDAEQSVMHLYTKCRKWWTERRVLKKSLRKLGSRWQERPEKRWLAELLANKYAVGPLLELLKETEVGRRGGERCGMGAEERSGQGGPIRRFLGPSCSSDSGGQIAQRPST